MQEAKRDIHFTVEEKRGRNGLTMVLKDRDGKVCFIKIGLGPWEKVTEGVSDKDGGVKKMNVLVYDLEIKKAILGKGETPDEAIQYCDGWNDHANMGISTVCAYSYTDDRYRVFCDDNLEEFAALVDAHDTIVSFNGLNFDNKVLAYALPGTVDPLRWLNEKSYDIFAEIRDVSGQWCGLDATIKANGLGTGKTGNGALAPVWYQTGQWGRLVDYCLMDTKLTKQLFDVILAKKPITNPKTGQPMILRMPTGS